MHASQFVAFREVETGAAHVLNLAYVVDIRPSNKDGEHTFFYTALDGVPIQADIRYTEVVKDIPALRYGFR